MATPTPPTPPLPPASPTGARGWRAVPLWLLVAVAWAAHSALLVVLVEAARMTPQSSLRWSIPVLGAVSAYWALATPAIRWLVPRIAPARVGGVGRSAAAHAAAALATSGGAVAVRWGMFLALGDEARFLGLLGRYVDYYAATYAAVAAIVAARDSHRAYVERARHALVLEAQLTRARLEFLQRQLQPHFLFNALNAVAELADEAPALAARMLRQLSRLLRAATEHLAVTEVALRDELLVLDAYVEVQRARFGEALEVVRTLDPRALDALVPTFVLQPLVENAIRHGLERRRGGGRVTVAAVADGERLRLRVEDSGDPAAAAAGAGGGSSGERGAPRSGIGLSNTRQRLAQLYGAAQRLELRRGADGGMVVEVELPLRRAVGAVGAVAAVAAAPVPARAVPDAGGGEAGSAADDADVVVALYAGDEPPAGAPDEVPLDGAMPGGTTLGERQPNDTLADPPDRSRVRRARLRTAAAIVAVWTGMGVVWTLQLALIGATQKTPIRWEGYAYQWAGAAVWAALTPLVLLLATRVRVAGGRRAPLAVAVHGVACAAISVAQVAAADRIMGYDTPLLTPVSVTPLGLNAIFYLAVVAWVNARHFVRSRRERAVAADRLAADVERLRLQSLALEVSPAFVGAVLDRTADVVTRDAARAEEVIEGLADLLRAMLDAPSAGASAAGGGHAPTARREIALVEACAALLALAFGRRVRVRTVLPPALRDARVPTGGLRPVLAAAAARLAERSAGALEIRVTATATPALGRVVGRSLPGTPVGALQARVIARSGAGGGPSDSSPGRSAAPRRTQPGSPHP